MEISKEQFILQALKAGLTSSQAEVLWDSLNDKATPQPSAVSNWMFYFGAMIIISAMTWLMNAGWELFGGGGIFLISVAYAFFFTCLGKKFWNEPDLRIPAGLFITIGVCMTPLAIYGLESYFGIWPPDRFQEYFFIIKGNRVFIELATIFTGLLALYFFPFPFLTLPIFFSAWLLSMDIVFLITRSENVMQQYQWVSLCFGIALIMISYFIQLRKKRDYAFWGYLFGLFTFWASFSVIVWENSETALFGYLVMNLILMMLSILLKNRIFMVFGAIGSFIYFSHLAYDVFKNSIWFPFVFSFIGLLIIYLGILYQKNIDQIEKKFFDKIPLRLRQFLPPDEEN